MGVVKGLLHTTNPSVCLLCRLENHRPFIKEQPEQARSALGHHLGFLKCDRGLRSQGTQFTYIVMIEGRPTFNHTLLYLSAVQYYLHAVVSKAPTHQKHITCHASFWRWRLQGHVCHSFGSREKWVSGCLLRTTGTYFTHRHLKSQNVIHFA